jgi:hypothetical protein
MNDLTEKCYPVFLSGFNEVIDFFGMEREWATEN